MICFYHLDDDGKCAAAIVNKYGIHDSYPDQFFEMNYGFKVPFDKIATDEMVYIVDFSFTPEDMTHLLEITANVVWIDHHVTIIEKYKDFPHHIDGVRSDAYSGCMLTYLFLTNQLHLLDKPYEVMVKDGDVPLIVQMCDDYDMWRFRLSATKQFHAGFEIFPHDPKDEIWNQLTDEETNRIANAGEAIIKYRADLMAKLIKSYGFEATFGGHRCYALNQGCISSDDFDTVAEDYDFLVGFIFDGEKFSYSLRSTENGPDVSVVASNYGGGGHVHASGCSSTEMLLQKVTDDK